jgi:hypothetical protein
MRRAIVVIVIFVVALAGCIGTVPDSPDDSDSEETPNSDETNLEESDEGELPVKSIGENATSKSFTATVTDYQRISEYEAIYYSNTLGKYESRGIETPREGATFVIIYLRVENTGETEENLPDAGDISLIYKGSEASSGAYESRFNHSGETYKTYWGQRDEKGEFVFPDVGAEGWIMYEVPEDFETSEAVVEIVMEQEDGDHETYSWRLE